MSIQSTLTITEKIESVKVYYKGEPMTGDWNSFTNYNDAYNSLKKNLSPGEWSLYSIVVVKTAEKTYRFVEA